MKITRRRAKNCGVVLPLAVSMIVLLVLIGLALIRLGLSARMQAIRVTIGISARTAADAGLTEAYRLMRDKLEVELTWDNSIFPYTVGPVYLPGDPYGNANYTFTITDDPNNSFIISSTGRAGTVEKTVCCQLELKSLWFGIGVKEGVDIKVETNFGTIPLPNGEFKIQTNSTEDGAVIFKAGVVIPGDVVVGPGGDPDSVINEKSSTTILGDTYASENPIDFPSVIVPLDLTSLPTTSYNYDPCGLTGDIKYSTLSLPNGTLQEIVGDCRIYVVGKMTLNNNAELLITPGSSLTLYLNGSLEDKNSSGITNSTNEAARFSMYGTDNCEAINLKAKSDFYGAIYAPNASLDIYNGGNLYGAFIGNQTLTIKNSGTFYFDTRLFAVWVDVPTAYLILDRSR